MSEQNLTRVKQRRKWKKAFLAVLRETGNVTLSAEATGISRCYAHQCKAKDKEFAKLWDDAIEHASDLLMAEARRRGAEGYPEPVIYQGQLMGQYFLDGKPVASTTPGAMLIPLTVKKYSDPLLLALLKAHKPEFREKVGVEHSGELKTKTEHKVKVEVQDALNRYGPVIQRLAERSGGSSVGGVQVNGHSKPMDTNSAN